MCVCACVCVGEGGKGEDDGGRGGGTPPSNLTKVCSDHLGEIELHFKWPSYTDSLCDNFNCPGCFSC